MAKVEVSGKTIAEALLHAALQLDATVEDLEYEVVSEPRRLLGVLGGGQYTLAAWIAGQAEAPAPAPVEAPAEAPAEAEEEAPEEAPEEELAAPAPTIRAQDQPVAADESPAAVAECARQLTEEILTLMGLPGEVRVVAVEDKDLKLTIDSPEAQGLIIGRHGETIDALQFLVAVGANRDLPGLGYRVHLDAGDYRERQADKLREMAHRHADHVAASGQEAVLPGLRGYERRVVHVALMERTDVETYSEGEGEDRQLVITPRTDATPAPEAADQEESE